MAKIELILERLPLKNLFIFSFVINVITIILGLLAKFILPPEIPLFYGLPQTVEQLAPSFFIVIPPFISIILGLTNALISLNVTSSYLKKSLAFATLLISLLAVIASLKIIFLVGSI